MAEPAGSLLPVSRPLSRTKEVFSLPKYLVKAGLDYGAVRKEAGEVAEDIPRQSVGWLLDQGLIEVVIEEAVSPDPTVAVKE